MSLKLRKNSTNTPSSHVISTTDQGKCPGKANELKAMIFLSATWECMSPETLVHWFKEVSISAENKEREQSDYESSFKLSMTSFM